MCSLWDHDTARGVPARTAAFRSADRGPDSVRLAAQLEADVLLVDAPAALVDDGELGPDARAVLATAACDVALLATAASLRVDPHGALLVPFGGSEHDWAALELAARLASSAALRSACSGSSTTRQGEDASRVLAGASLVLQRIVGIAAEPRARVARPGRAGRRRCGRRAARRRPLDALAGGRARRRAARARAAGRASRPCSSAAASVPGCSRPARARRASRGRRARPCFLIAS